MILFQNKQQVRKSSVYDLLPSKYSLWSSNTWHFVLQSARVTFFDKIPFIDIIIISPLIGGQL